jgi:hypothetical protein
MQRVSPVIAGAELSHFMNGCWTPHLQVRFAIALNAVKQ